MKKLVFMFVAFAAISFASCGGQQAPAEEVVDSVVDSVEVAVDSAADSVVVEAEEAAEEVVEVAPEV